MQFAMASMFHFIFVPLTLGLSVLVALMEWKYVRTGDEKYKKMTKFWGKLFLINFALGVVTGITLEFQFGTNWSVYSAFVGDIFGSLLAVEATAAFFLESVFLGAWIFGWDRLSKKMHAWCITFVAFATNLSAFWILTANGFMQNPLGYTIVDGRAELASFMDVVLNPTGLNLFFHQIFAAWILAGFFVLGISAWHLLRKNETDFFNTSFRYGIRMALACSLLVAVQGHFHGQQVAKTQPAKLAAMEGHWETEENASFALISVPDPANERNSIEFLKIPGLLSFLVHDNFHEPVIGLKDFPKEDRPPVTPVFWSFRVMIGLGMLFIVLASLGWLWQNKLETKPLYLRALVYTIPLPYIANQAGWIVTEVGRQPWIVQGLMRTSEAVSPITTPQVAFSFSVMLALYILLGALDIMLLKKYATKGPVEHEHHDPDGSLQPVAAPTQA
jgi:cytochrome d ubiquinol oxidase subunit I